MARICDDVTPFGSDSCDRLAANRVVDVMKEIGHLGRQIRRRQIRCVGNRSGHIMSLPHY